MTKHDKVYDTYVAILEEELKPAMGCTEPICVALCAAKARDILGDIPTELDVKVSGNILKNVKSVVVPNTNGLVGTEAAVAAGIIGGKTENELNVISEVTEEQIAKIKEYLDSTPIKVAPAYSDEILDVVVTAKKDGHEATARIIKSHANIVYCAKDGEVLYEAPQGVEVNHSADRKLLNVKDIYEFAKIVDIEDVKAPILRQVECNSAISHAGLTEDWGATVGQVLLKTAGDDIRIKARAAAAAGSDARMSGCDLPVVIVSGSGNQGITASMPVVTYAKELGKSEEEMIRALVVSDLVAVHEKTPIGAMSAFCGAMCAGSGAGAGIAFMLGATEEEIEKVIITSLGMVSGMVCDGAKPSCACKISAAVECGILAYDLLKNGKRLKGGDGILDDCVEQTIANVGRMGHDGMADTDLVIQAIMTGN